MKAVDEVVWIIAPTFIGMQFGCLVEGQESLQNRDNIIIGFIVGIVGLDCEKIEAFVNKAVDLLGRGNIA